jgi:hypothetical protein
MLLSIYRMIFPEKSATFPDDALRGSPLSPRRRDAVCLL